MPGYPLPNFQPSRFRPLSGGGAPAFVPTDSSDLLEWWEPSIATTATNSNGTGTVADDGAVGLLEGRSTNGHDASTTTTAFKPTYEEHPGGKTGLRIDASAKSQLEVPTLTLSNGGNMTLVVAASLANSGDRLYAMSCGEGGGVNADRLLFAYSNNTQKMGVFDGSSWLDLSTGNAPGGSHVWTWVLDGDAGEARGYIDGVLQATDTGYMAQDIIQGVNLFARDDDSIDVVDQSVNSIQIYDAALSDEDRANAEAYAASTLFDDKRYIPSFEFSSVTTIGSDVHASQGVNGDGTYFWTTADPNNLTIYTYNNSSGSFGTLVTSRAPGQTATIGQVNGTYRDGSTLYVSANNFSTTPATGHIIEYDIETDGSLTYVDEYSVGANWSEGLVKDNGEFFVVYHDLHAIARYNSSFVFQELHDLPRPNPNTVADDYYQDIDTVTIGGTKYFAVNVHGENPNSPLMHFYTFDGSDFTFEGYAVPPANCTQGFYFEDDSTIVFAQRPTQNATPPNNVVRATIAAA